MKHRSAIVLLALCGILFPSCQSDLKIVEKQLLAKVRQDAPYLATLEAEYGIVFTNTRANLVLSDDFYIRKDQAKVSYGYALKDDQIKCIQEGKDKTLLVKLPLPRRVSIDRGAQSIKFTHKAYQPVDKTGNPVNVDEMINQRLEEAIKKYEDGTIEMTQTISRQYFETLAEHFGMKLKLEFS